MRVWVVPSVNWVLITSHDFVDLLLRKRNVLNHCLVISRGEKNLCWNLKVKFTDPVSFFLKAFTTDRFTLITIEECCGDWFIWIDLFYTLYSKYWKPLWFIHEKMNFLFVIDLVWGSGMLLRNCVMQLPKGIQDNHNLLWFLCLILLNVLILPYIIFNRHVMLKFFSDYFMTWSRTLYLCRLETSALHF